MGKFVALVAVTLAGFAFMAIYPAVSGVSVFIFIAILMGA